MKLSCTASLLLVLNTASAFGTPSDYWRRHSFSFTFFRGSPTTFSSLKASTLDNTIISTDNLNLLSERGRNICKQLQQEESQRHVFGDWPPPGTDDDNKIRLAEQVRKKCVQWSKNQTKPLWNMGNTIQLCTYTYSRSHTHVCVFVFVFV